MFMVLYLIQMEALYTHIAHTCTKKLFYGNLEGLTQPDDNRFSNPVC